MTDTLHRRLVLFAVFVAVAWAAVVWFLLRPPEIAADWNAGRQSDTQTIAIYLTNPGASLLRPQIAWGGDGSGYVETELQLYTGIIAALMGVFGRVEWLGQLISLLCILASGAVLWQHLGKRYGIFGAFAGLLSFLAQRSSLHLSSVVMPDALALLAYITAWAAIYRYATTRRTRDLVIFAVVGAIAMMQKPTTAQIGVSSFILIAMTGGIPRLRDYRIWLAWAGMVAVLGLFLVHAHGLYVESGNTFGMLFGQEGKAPHLRHLFMPEVLGGAIKNTLRWGYGHVGILALLALIALRRVEAEHIALAVGNAVITLIALRYTSQDAGNYYFAPANVLAASAVASVTQEIVRVLSGRWRQVALAAILAVFALQFARNAQVRYLYAHFDDPEVASVIATGKELRKFASPQDLIVARTSHMAARDTFWDTRDADQVAQERAPNFGDPRLFYVSGTRGWALGSDQSGTDLISTAADRGARFFADPVAKPDPKLEAFLQQHAELLWSVDGLGRIWRLHPSRTSATR